MVRKSILTSQLRAKVAKAIANSAVRIICWMKNPAMRGFFMAAAPTELGVLVEFALYI
jgi:hypothetical protein